MVDYLSFNGDEYDMVSWTGQHVALLTLPKMSVDPAVISRLLGALDGAWEYYSSSRGVGIRRHSHNHRRKPTPDRAMPPVRLKRGAVHRHVHC
jgi:hypothetical protein